MTDNENFYRERLDACLAAAGVAVLPQVIERHVSAANAWRRLLDGVLERQAQALSTAPAASPV